MRIFTKNTFLKRPLSTRNHCIVQKFFLRVSVNVPHFLANSSTEYVHAVPNRSQN